MERLIRTPENELLLAAARFSYRFQSGIQTLLGSHPDSTPGTTQLVMVGKNQGYETIFKLPVEEATHELTLTNVVVDPTSTNKHRIPRTIIHIEDMNQEAGNRPYISFRLNEQGYFTLSASGHDLQDVTVDSSTLPGAKALKEQLNDPRFTRAFTHFGIPSQILTEAPPTT